MLRRASMTNAPGLLIAGATALLLSLSASVPAAMSKEPHAKGTTESVKFPLDTWLVFVGRYTPSEGNSSEYFATGGQWTSYSPRHEGSGHYKIVGTKLCVTGVSGYGYCRILSTGPHGELFANNVGGVPYRYEVRSVHSEMPGFDAVLKQPPSAPAVRK
jgi:hypothetical protein